MAPLWVSACFLRLIFAPLCRGALRKLVSGPAGFGHPSDQGPWELLKIILEFMYRLRIRLGLALGSKYGLPIGALFKFCLFWSMGLVWYMVYGRYIRHPGFGGGPY